MDFSFSFISLIKLLILQNVVPNRHLAHDFETAIFGADVSYKNPKFKIVVLTLILTLNLTLTLTIMLYFRING